MMQTDEICVAALRQFEALSGVPEDQLAWLVSKSNCYTIAEGDYLFRPEDSLVNTHFILRGSVKVFRSQGSQQFVVTFWEGGSISGYLPFSRGKMATAYGQAVEETEVISFSKEYERELIANHYELTQALVQVMTSRVREFTALQKQNEKMMALGKLSAGLAHELNNPAAAIVRGSAELIKHLQFQPDAFKKVIRIHMTDEQVDTVNNLLFEKLRQPKPQLGLMERTDREDELADWLADHGIKKAAELAENLVEFGFLPADIDVIAEHVPDKDMEPVLRWVDNNLTTERMVADIQEASERISNLINAIKSYTHMDRAPEKHPADVHLGIRSTLTMLGHKVKKNGVRIVEDFDESIPLVPMFVSEVNQVWTNVVDNALDALEGRPDPEIAIKTLKDGDYLTVYITDNGPGIPADIIDRIWEPFFTTKELGKGTGLGLELVYQIMARHGGEANVTSKPGETTFSFCFPLGEA